MSQWVFNNTFLTLPEGFGTPVSPQPLTQPFLISVNPQVCRTLDLDPKSAKHPDFINIFTGNDQLAGFAPFAMKYTGHQFGQYNPDLGDGRGLLMGEVINNAGEKWDIHLKGSGITPYSRMGDGRAVLRSCIREYLASAAMHGLGIATTHALAVLSSDTPVYREDVERGSTLVRVTESHLRFGHFEYLFYTGQHDKIATLADYLITHHFPDLAKLDSQNRYQAMFKLIVTRTAHMIADWQAVGFAHGVMNTDNMSVLGLTLDYGPFGFLDDYEPGYICNHSDYTGRYAFNRQPSIALWNLSALGYALSSLIDKQQIETVLDTYEPTLQAAYNINMQRKLGLDAPSVTDAQLYEELFALLASQHVDYTLFFRTLSHIAQPDIPQSASQFRTLFSQLPPLEHWLKHYAQRLTLQTSSDEQRRNIMLNNNPKYILRNYLAQQAIEKAEHGDVSMINDLLIALSTPFDEQPHFESLAAMPPAWGKKIIISCSS
ncbi:protein adenylyltransferase SelO [Photobacterium aquae]|uniref:protein adenylyltransferase SelO n=1 Tax=Photobacterium aquae TaxID=1195763 RepID=UPI003B846C67